MTAAITAVFAALVWHTQSLRDDIDRYGQSAIPEHTEDCELALAEGGMRGGWKLTKKR